MHKISNAAEPELACWKRSNALFISCFGWFGMGSDRSKSKSSLVSQALKSASANAQNSIDVSAFGDKLYTIVIVTVLTDCFLFYFAAAPDYLIPLIASLVVLAAILLLILCIRGKWRERRRANRETRLAARTTLKKKRNAAQEKPLTNARTYYNQTSTDSTTSSSTSTSTHSTELRNFEYNRASLLDSTPSMCSTPQVLSPPLSPKEEGAKDEWRRFRVQRNSTQIEIIV